MMLKAAAGWDLSVQDWEDQMLRASFMERCLCIREGYVPMRDDTLPDRFLEETIYSKYGEPKILHRGKFLETRKKAYFSYGLTEEGIPPKQTLENLGMGFVIPMLEEKLGLLK